MSPSNEGVSLAQRQPGQQEPGEGIELEIPEVFTLPPLSHKRINVKVHKSAPARFYFVDEVSDSLEDGDV